MPRKMKISIILFIVISAFSTGFSQSGKLAGFSISQFFNEQLCTFKYPSDVTVHINAPCADSMRSDRLTSVILFALPNGNSTAWTIGKEAGPSDDWHYEIQHIGAQTRFLRQLVRDRNIVTVYLEADGQSWPTWSGNHPNDRYTLIYALVDSIRRIFNDYPHEVVLNGHSGGGSFVFNFINGQSAIPDYVKRIAFLDSDYNYSNDSGHGVKLAEWLNASSNHFLCVLAYNDSVALYEGVPIVSATGGTWYRSKMMQRKLAEYYSFTFEENDDFLKYFALNGRIQFWLKKNPTRAILHTVQVERNGYIHSITSGTTNDQNGYQYYGAHAYDKYVQRLPPEDIGSFIITTDTDGQLRLTLKRVEHGDIYRIYWSHDGVNFRDSTDVQDSSIILSGLEADSLYFFRLQGISPWGQSQKTEVLAGTPGSNPPGVLIVNGFDVVKSDNTRDFVRQHARAFTDNGFSVASASNDAFTAGMIQAATYPIIDFIVGSDLYLTETVSPDEQTLLKTYLQNGGHLIISGLDMAYDLDSKGKADDKDFCYNYLKMNYLSRSPLNQSSVYYQVEFDAEWTDLVGPFSFDDGTHGTYNVSRPDAIQAINGSHPALTFTGVDTSNGVAGIWFAGFFPEGTKPGKIFVTTVPIETIYPDSGRSQFVKGILDFFASESAIAPSNAILNSKFSLGFNFPNPFNAETHIAFSLPSPGNARLTIYNALGQIIDRPVENAYDAGRHEIVWRTNNLPSGIYFYRLEAVGHSTVRKMALVK